MADTPFRRNRSVPHPRSNWTGPPPVTRYRVFLHRASDQDLAAVVRAVMDLTHFGTAEAEYRMWEAHHRGRAVVLVTHLERAELYVEQFADRGLPASIEPE